MKLPYALPKFMCHAACMDAMSDSEILWELLAQQPGGTNLVPVCNGVISHSPLLFNGLHSYPVLTQTLIDADQLPAV